MTIGSTPARRAARGAATLLVPLTVLGASVALAPGASALVRDDGDDPGVQPSALVNLWIYAIAPALLFAVITLLVYAPSMAKGPRYRPDKPWTADPTWIRTDAGPAGRGPSGSHSSTTQAGVGTTVGEDTRQGGGSGASW